MLRVRSTGFRRAILFAMLLAASAWARPGSAIGAGTFYVDNTNPNADDSGPGTEERPYHSIYTAVRKRGAPGTAILVKPGTYGERVSFSGLNGGPGNELILRALGEVVMVDPGDAYGGGLVATGASYIVIEGFEVRGAYEAIEIYYGDHITVRDNHVPTTT